MADLIEHQDESSLSSAVATTAAGSKIPPLDWDGTELPEDVFEHPLLDEAAWIALRDSGRRPFDSSPPVTTYQSRAEFLVGAWIIDKIVPPRLGGSLLANLQPQMLREADTLAAEHFRNAVLMPRRSSKTTTLWCVLLGRCYMRPVYMAAYTMLTTAKKAGERFKLDVRDPIIRKWREKPKRPMKLAEGNGALGVEFPNGSKLAVLSPNGDDVRSGAYDMLVMDEAGEAEPDTWDDIVAAVVPSFDTRGEGAQLVYAGTGGKYREGSHFWKTLHDPEAGRIRYGVPDDIDDKLMESWGAGAGRLIEELHPGLDGLTTLEKIRSNFPDLGAERFALEYLGHFGRETGVDRALSFAHWANTTGKGRMPTGIKPAALAFAVHPGGAWASIAVAWYLPDEGADLVRAALALTGDDPTPPRVGVKLVHHQAGNAGIEYKLRDLAREYRLPLAHDGGSPQDKAVMARVLRISRPRPQGKPLTLADKSVATAALLGALDQGTIEHWEQAPLDKAASLAVFRPGKMRLLGVPDDSDPDQDVSPLEAVAYAMHALPDPSTGTGRKAIVIS